MNQQIMVIKKALVLAALAAVLSAVVVATPVQAQGLAMAPAHIFPILKAGPVSPEVEAKTHAVNVRYTRRVVVTAYNSLPEQTDSTPCLTANGYDLCGNDREDVVAANFLRFGTKIRIPDRFGSRVFTVQDRMHPRFSQRVDIWMRERTHALAFGARYLEIEVLE